MDTTTPPFAELTPASILDAVESLGLTCDGRLLELNSYENRVYQVGIETQAPVVVKFYRPHRWSDAAIIEEHAFLNELADLEIPVVPPLAFDGKTLHQFGSYRLSAFPRQGGHAPELDAPGTLERIGRFLGRIHAAGAARAYQARPTLDIESFGEASRDFLLSSGFIPPELHDTWHSVVEEALNGVRRCYERVGTTVNIRLHGDCHIGNILWTDDGPHFVDFDDSRNGPAVQDLWMLLSGSEADMAQQLGQFLKGYTCFHDFDHSELHLVEALRTLRLIRFSAWIARRWHDPAFPRAFPWFNTQRYWEERILELREQIALLDEPPLLYTSSMDQTL